jgi:mannosyltransferase OCH1-like enzyme
VALPGYEIKEWTEASYDVNKSAFTWEAHANGKWAFLTDFARLDVLHQYCSIYLDVDVYKGFTPLLSDHLSRVHV